jgi:hypothetical protein
MAHPPPRGPQAMSEPEKPKRRWFQFQLLTAISISISGGLFVWANIRLPGIFSTEGMLKPWAVYGFPNGFVMQDPHGRRFELHGLVSDVIFGMILLATTGYISEWLIRRRESETERLKAKPKRRFWQIHLSTALLSTILFGAALPLNIQKRYTSNYQYPEVWYLDNPVPNYEWNCGWPFTYCHAYGHFENNPYPSTKEEWRKKERERLKSGTFEYPDRYDYEEQDPIRIALLSIDILLTLGMVFAFVLTSEWLIRRRKGRKP